MPGTKTQPPKFRIIVTEDNLDYWVFPGKEHVKSIETVWLQDYTTGFYMCTAIPGFEAEPLYPVITFHDGITEEERDRMENEIYEGFYMSADPVYYTWMDDKNIVCEVPDLTVSEKEEFDQNLADHDWETARQMLINELIEYYNSNPPY